MRRGRERNGAIFFALILLPGLLMAPAPAAARRGKRQVKVRKAARAVPSRPGPVRPKATTGRMILGGTRRARPVFTSASQLPRPRPGTVRLYRGTGHPDRVQVSRSMRGRPEREVPRGDRSFFGPFEAVRVADRHAFGADHAANEAVSTTTNLGAARGFARTNGGAVMVYDVPEATFEKLPHGDRTTGERIFRYSVPDELLVGVLREP